MGFVPGFIVFGILQVSDQSIGAVEEHRRKEFGNKGAPPVDTVRCEKRNKSVDSVGYQADLARLSALQAKQGDFMGRKKTQARQETTLSLSDRKSVV